jgi:tripeptide aminopeptidase
MRLLLCGCLAAGLHAQSFSPESLKNPAVARALDSIAPRQQAIVEDWIRLTEIPSPSGGEQKRAAWIRGELAKLPSLSEIKTDSIGNVSAVRKGSGVGKSLVFAAHMDTVFPASTPIKVQRDGNLLKAPGIGDCTGNLIAVLELFRALDRAQVKTKGDLIFLATVQEETRLKGAGEWLRNSGYRPDHFAAVDIGIGNVWYGAFRISRLRFRYTSSGSHTLFSRGLANPAKAVAKAITDLYAMPLPQVEPGLEEMKLPVLNVGMIGGGTVVNAIPREAWFTVDLRSLDSATQDRLESAVVRIARAAADAERVGFQTEKPDGNDFDYSKARAREERQNHPFVKAVVDVMNHFGAAGPAGSKAIDAGSTDANVGVAMGIPSIAIGAIRQQGAHTLEESAEADSIAAGVKVLIAVAVATAGI